MRNGASAVTLKGKDDGDTKERGGEILDLFPEEVVGIHNDSGDWLAAAEDPYVMEFFFTHRHLRDAGYTGEIKVPSNLRKTIS